MDWDIQNANSIHFFGDSLTAGYGTLPQYGWIYQISRRCPAIQYYNHGLCGAGLEDIFDSLSLFLSSPHENTLFFMTVSYTPLRAHETGASRMPSSA